jgi:hypothetical protein
MYIYIYICPVFPLSHTDEGLRIETNLHATLHYQKSDPKGALIEDPLLELRV